MMERKRSYWGLATAGDLAMDRRHHDKKLLWGDWQTAKDFIMNRGYDDEKDYVKCKRHLRSMMHHDRRTGMS